MYSRYLFVGLGGSGGKTLRFLKDQLSQWMTTHDMPAQVPAGWRFLHIDTPNIPDGKDINNTVRELSKDEYLGLSRQNSQYPEVIKQLDSEKRLAEEMATWRPEPTVVQVPLSQGAGQYRAIGAAIGLAQAPKIREAIRNSLARLTHAEANSELADIYNRVNGGAGSDVAANTYTVVVSSLSGGSGSGLLHTVCDILSCESDGQRPIALLYTPEVFGTLDPSARGGVQANALASVCELMNGYWWGGNPDPEHDDIHPPPLSDQVLRLAGCSRDLHRSGPAFPFLIGMKNASDISYGTHDQLFEMVGRAMSSWVVDLKVHQQFVAHTTGNWQQAAERGSAVLADIDSGCGKNEIDYPLASGLGFARLAIGTSYFERYASERLMRAVYDHLVNYHHKSDAARKTRERLTHNDPQEIIASLAEARIGNFLKTAGIDISEPDTGAQTSHQMAKIFTPAGFNVLDFNDEVEASLQGYGAQRAPLTEWDSRIVYLVADHLDSAITAHSEQIDEAATAWVDDFQTSVLDAANRELDKSGLLITAACCSLAADHLHVLSGSFSQAASSLEAWAARWKTAAETDGHAASKGAHFTASDAAVLDRIDLICGHGWGYRADHMILSKTAEMLREAASRLLAPIGEDLRAAHRSAEREEIEYPNWADNRIAMAAPPAAVGPPTGTRTLLETKRYKEYFDHLMGRTFPASQGAVLDQARRQILDTNLIRPAAGGEGSWWPSGVSSSRQPQEFTAEVQVGRAGLRSSTSGWLNRAGSAFGDFLGVTFRSLLAGGAQLSSDVAALLPQDHANSRFMSEMNTVLRSAAPLVNVDEALAALVHPGQPMANRLACSTIPLDGLPIQKEAVDLLNHYPFDSGVIDGLFTADDDISHIDITASFEAPRSVLTIRSLFRPIADDWTAHLARGQRSTFWSHRRARPLRRFVPAPYSMLMAMIRGWFIGSLLGQIKLDPERVQIARPGRDPAIFPQRLNHERPRSLDWLSSSLESMALAYVDATRQGSLVALDPYVRLRELGAAGNGSLYAYPVLGDELAAWIETGRLRTPAIGEMKVTAYGDLSEPQRASEVSKILQDGIKAHQQTYQQESEQWKRRPATLSKAPLWTGLWSEIERALTQISQTAAQHSTRSGIHEPII